MPDKIIPLSCFPDISEIVKDVAVFPWTPGSEKKPITQIYLSNFFFKSYFIFLSIPSKHNDDDDDDDMSLCMCSQTATRNLVASGRYNTRSDFTVVLQPFFRNVIFPVLPVK